MVVSYEYLSKAHKDEYLYFDFAEDKIASYVLDTQVYSLVAKYRYDSESSIIYGEMTLAELEEALGEPIEFEYKSVTLN